MATSDAARQRLGRRPADGRFEMRAQSHTLLWMTRLFARGEAGAGKSLGGSASGSAISQKTRRRAATGSCPWAQSGSAGPKEIESRGDGRLFHGMGLNPGCRGLQHQLPVNLHTAVQVVQREVFLGAVRLSDLAGAQHDCRQPGTGETAGVRPILGPDSL